MIVGITHSFTGVLLYGTPPPSLQRFVVVATKAGSPACVSDNGGKKGKYMLLKRLSPEKHRTVSHGTRLILATSPDGALLTSLAQPFATVQCDSFSCPVSGGHVKYDGLCFVARLRCLFRGHHRCPRAPAPNFYGANIAHTVQSSWCKASKKEEDERHPPYKPALPNRRHICPP